MEYSIEYLRLLAEKHPSEAAVCSELINLKSILALPKGTEHFISDLHGQYDAVCHILNNCSGVILEKTLALYSDTLGERGCRELCSIIYYPREALTRLEARGELSDGRLSDIIRQMLPLAEMLSGKYTRSYVRKRMPQDYEFVLDELLHMQRDEDENQHRYHDAIISAIVSSGAARDLITAISELIKSLAVDRLHVVGDIFDRGAQPERIVDLLMAHSNVDIQWGNHDILWMGAAAGSPACIAAVLRISLDYGNMSVLERGYGISLRPLTEFCEKCYGGADAKRYKHALSILGFKLEGQLISRHPGFEMDERLLLDKIDFSDFTVKLAGKRYALNTKDFPTLDPAHPYALTSDEEALIDEYVSAFRESLPLRRHMDYIFKNGSTYLCCNGNLLFHGCIPLTPEGGFARVRHEGQYYSGRALLDYCDRVVARAWGQRDESALDMMWYLWCGQNSPFSGRCFHTFELALIDDEETWVEPKNAYFDFWEDVDVIKMLLREFGLDPETGHIINGHTPVKAKLGESPVKAGGKLFIIDGGFCKAYQPKTGLAGYTLIYNSHGLRLKSHRPFSGVAAVLDENADMESDSVCVETFPRRRYIGDTDHGKKLSERIDALNSLLSAYRSGLI
ncbi:MAG: fructose-1,6-bisphosphatase [Oscillospiraceae bacterium]